MRLKEHSYLSPRVKTLITLDLLKGRVMRLAPEDEMKTRLRTLQTQEDIDDLREPESSLIFRTYMRVRAGNEQGDNVTMTSYNTSLGYARPRPNLATGHKYPRRPAKIICPSSEVALRATIKKSRTSNPQAYKKLQRISAATWSISSNRLHALP